MTHDTQIRDGSRQLLPLLALLGVLAVVVAAVIGATALTASAQDNDIGFDGTVELTGDRATDGTSWQYSINNLSAVENATVELEGALSNHEQSTSGSSTTGTIDVGGDRDPVDETVSVEVDNQDLEYYSSRREKGTSSDSGATLAFSQDTNVSKVSAISFEWAVSGHSDCGGDYTPSDFFYGPSEVQVYAEGEAWGTVVQDGDTSWTQETVTGEQIVSDDGTLNTSFDFSGFGSDSTYWRCIRDVTVSGPNGTTVDATIGGQSTQITEGEPAPVDLSTGTTDVSVDHDLATWSASWAERYETVDPQLSVNGNTVSYDGVLDPGQTTTLDVDESWIQEGTNAVDLSIGDGSTPRVVNVSYTHGAATEQSVAYSGETWSERYNVSRSFGADQDDVELSIPFSSSRVVAIRDVQLRHDGGNWQDITGDATSLNGTTLNVAIGAVDAGDSVSVRANGSKVDVQSGAIEVTDPTVEGNDLSTRFRVVDDGGGGPVEIGVGSTVSGTRLHHLASSSWTSSERSRITTDEQVLKLPDAPTNGEATVATAPLEIAPETGDVVASTDNASDPRFSLAPGEQSGDVVSIRYLTATSGEEYALVDVTGDRVVDRGTASSPVTLETNDESSIYTIRIAEGGGGGGGQVVTGAPTTAAVSGSSGLPVLLLVVSVGGVVGTWVLARRFGAGRASKWLVATVGLMSTFIVAEFATPASVVGTLSGDLLHGSGQSVMSVIVGSALLVGVILLNRRLDSRLPTPVIGLIAAGVGFWMVSSIAPMFVDALGASLQEVGPLFWMAVLIGGGYLAYRYIKARRSPDTQVTLSLGDK